MAPITAIQFGAHRVLDKMVTTATGKPLEGLNSILVATGTLAALLNPLQSWLHGQTQMVTECTSPSYSSTVSMLGRTSPSSVCSAMLLVLQGQVHCLPLWAARQSW